jgi:hypothetical protein
MNNLSAAAEPSVELAEPGDQESKSNPQPATAFTKTTSSVREDGKE